MSKVTLQKLQKKFGSVQAVKSLDLEIEEGEFFSLLGPSGCGKTTTLRMIAGFEFPTSGSILFDDLDVTFIKPNLRNTGMVFQNFALFPHMTVSENVAFGVKARKTMKSEIEQRVEKVLDLVDLKTLANRSVTQLSGGQQQRVALARAIVIEPQILLLDEPLSNLDAKLRQQTRAEIKALQRRLKITTIYVTHDQEEALSVSDRIGVMKEGICVQVGTPAEIYQKPANTFVAKFVGNSNILRGELVRKKDEKYVQITPEWKLAIKQGEVAAEQQIFVSLRPEHIFFNIESNGNNIFNGRIENINHSGSVIEYAFDVFGKKVQVKRLASSDDFQRKIGDSIVLTIHPERVYLLET